MRLLALLGMILLAANMAETARILGYFPFPSKSHQNIFAPILVELARRGHEVVYVTPVAPTMSAPGLQIRLQRNSIDKALEVLDLKSFAKASAFGMSRKLFHMADALSEEFYGDEVAQELIHSSEEYDAVLIESYFVQEPASAFLHKFGCPAIEVSTLGNLAWLNELSGLPDNPAYQVDFKSVNTDTMNFWERLHNTYILASTIGTSYYHLFWMQQVMDKYFNYTGWESRPPLRQLVSNRSVILVNTDVVLGSPYPEASHVKDIGGINILPTEPLPQDIQKFMDDAEDGVIFFSMGSNLKTSEIASGPVGDAFMLAFSQIKQRVLMKYEASDRNEKLNIPPNVKTSKWFPQKDILAHKKCLLFITHGGFLSLTETAYHGIPVVGIPFFGDQKKNIRHVETAGFGVRLEYENISRASVDWALREVLGNSRYSTEARRRSSMLRDRRHTGLEEAIYWIEHSIKYPNALTPRAANLSFLQLHLIDIYLFILASLLLVVFSLYKLITAIKALFRKKSPVDKKIKRS